MSSDLHTTWMLDPETMSRDLIIEDHLYFEKDNIDIKRDLREIPPSLRVGELSFREFIL
jgi:hypothetical protein